MVIQNKFEIPWSREQRQIITLIQCPVCHNDYVGKTDRDLITKLSEHGKNEYQPMFQHFWSCEKFNYILNLYSPADIFADTRTVDHIGHVYYSVIDNCKILE